MSRDNDKMRASVCEWDGSDTVLAPTVTGFTGVAVGLTVTYVSYTSAGDFLALRVLSVLITDAASVFFPSYGITRANIS